MKSIAAAALACVLPILASCGGGGSGGSSGGTPVTYNPLDKIYFAAPLGADNLPRFYSMNRDGSHVQLVASLANYDPGYTDLGLVDPSGATVLFFQFLANDQERIVDVSLNTGAQSFSFTNPLFSSYYGADYTALLADASDGVALNKTGSRIYYGGYLQTGDDPHNIYSMNVDGSGKQVLWTAPSGYEADLVGVSPDEKTLVVLENKVTDFSGTVLQITAATGAVTSSFKVPVIATYMRVNREFTKLAYLDINGLTFTVPHTCNLDGSGATVGAKIPFQYGPDLSIQIADFVDGFHVIYVAYDKLGAKQVYSSGIDGKGVKQLTYLDVGVSATTTRGKPKHGTRLGVR